jgi:hypothetical protein
MRETLALPALILGRVTVIAGVQTVPGDQGLQERGSWILRSRNEITQLIAQFINLIIIKLAEAMCFV